jgi:hypothetical protein
MELGTEKLRGIIKKSDNGRCPLGLGDEDVKHILLSCSETTKWRLEFFKKKMADYE